MKNFIKVVCLLSAVGFGATHASAKTICGTNERNEIYCTNYEGMEHGQWERVPGELKQVVVSDDHLWGVNANGDIFYADNYRSPTWVHLQGKAKEISEGHGLLCSVNNKDEIWCADKGITTSTPEWKKAPDGARLKFISVN